jgi:hypothetical protein
VFDSRKVCTTYTILILGSFWNINPLSTSMNDNQDEKIGSMSCNLDEPSSHKRMRKVEQWRTQNAADGIEVQIHEGHL